MLDTQLQSIEHEQTWKPMQQYVTTFQKYVGMEIQNGIPVRCTSWRTLMSKPPENLPPLPDNAKTKRQA